MSDKNVMGTDSICQKYCAGCKKSKCEVRKAREKFIERMVEDGKD